ncbi:MAG: autotransporter domain-containing protein [Acetobacter fabarum]|jgi:outer membrane autotransporter protein|uniref:autotransporter domain-containing protein n=1 Tax=Acetobacter fabarum TaxID=483199 RepID=UPI00242D5B01|nr:autotransporter domain-containing protein [Acetobacter fabarum]MCH4026006.1 autotransporter domain-containing protein [Acetobacter fabarum]MCH4086133.1 autotransporter domain-containing protein [Acetobacter fabarum]MCH4128348.1 autotransporter domain-containing protein [Acetobacter fabarum]MCH4138008.1 autotransporter domain-containing protein [Acetobacter fabarum]MCH4141560.1 autotransporter domain-containing protein [Acetobacter fabarum]
MLGKCLTIFRKPHVNGLKVYLFTTSLFVSVPAFAASSATDYTVAAGSNYSVSNSQNINLTNNGSTFINSSGRIAGTTTNNGMLNNSGTLNNTTNSGTFYLTRGTTGSIVNLASGSIRATFGTMGDVNNYGSMTLSAAETLNIINQQDATFSNLSGTINGSFENSGTAKLSATAIQGGLTNHASGTFTTNSIIGSDVSNSGILNLNGSAMVQGNVVSDGGTVTLSGMGVYVLGTLEANGGTFNVINGAVNALSGTANGTLTGTLIINRAGNALYSGVMSGPGGISLSGGVQSFSGQNTYTGMTAVSANAALNLSGSIAGSLTNNSSAANPTIITSTGKVFGNVLNIGQLTVNGTIGGLVNNSNTGVIQAASNAVFEQSLINSGTATLSSSSVIKGNVTDTTGSTFNLTGSSQVLGDVNNAGTANINTNATVVGNFTNSTVLNMDAATIQGALSNIGVMTIQNNSHVGSVENKSGTATFSDSTIAGAAVNDSGGTLTLNAGTVDSVANAGTLLLAKNNTVLHNTTNTSGTLTLDGNTINGQLLANGGTFDVTANGATIGSLSGSANGTLDGLLTLATADNTYSGTLSGTGGVSVSASGTQVFSGNNAYTGTTQITSGILAINGDQSTATGDTLVNATATLSGTGTLGGNTVIQSGGTLTPGDVTSHVGILSMAQNLTLASGSSQNFYLGQTNIAGGAYNSLVAVQGDLTLGGTLSITPNTAGPNVNNNSLDPGLYRLYTYGGTLSGAADQTLAPTSVAPGATASLQTSIDHQVNLVINYGNLTFWDGGSTTNRSNNTVDGGSGTWDAQTGTNDLNWTDKTGQTNGPWVNGQFVVYAGNAGTVTVQDTYNGVTNNVVASGMQFANNDGKIYTVTGDNIYANSASTLIRVGDGTTAGASITAILDTVLNDQLVSGGTSLVKTDLGTLIITKDQTYQGATSINGGVLQLGNGGTSGALAAGTAIHNNGVLAINHSGTFTLAQSIDGTGGLAQNGAGTTVLSANSTYTGATTVTQGTLEVDGSITSSSVDVSNGGTLSGSGSVGDTVIGSGGTLATPDVQNSVRVAGNLQTAQNSTLALQGTDQLSGKVLNLQGTQYQQLQSNTLSVAGSAALSGTVVLNVTPATSLKLNEYYTILTTGNGFLQKTYSLQTNLSSPYTFISPSLYYNGNDLDVLMARNSLSFASVTNTRNERETAQMLDRVPQSSAIVGAMEHLNAAQARRSMNTLSGEVHASARTALVQDSFLLRQAAMERLDTADCNKGYVDDTLHTASLKTGRKDEGCLSEQTVLWGQAYGSLGHNGGDGNAAALHHSTTGFIMGVDTPILNNTWRIGSMLSYGRTMFDVGSGRGSSGHGNTVSLGGYAGTHWGALTLKLGAAYTWNMLSLQRNVAFPGYADRLSSSYLGGTAQGFGELGYRLYMGRSIAEPFANVAYVNLHTNGYHEHGGAAALRGAGMDTGVTFSTFGVKASSSFHAGRLLLIPHGSVAYRHAFGLTTPTTHMLFAAGGSGSMDIAGTPLSTDAVVLDTGLSARLSDRIKIGLSYTGQYGAQSVESGVKASMLLKF